MDNYFVIGMRAIIIEFNEIKRQQSFNVDRSKMQ